MVLQVAAWERALEVLIGQRVVGVEARPGELVLDLSHRGTDDDACKLVVPFESIYFDHDTDAGR